MTDLTSLELAIKHLEIATDNIRRAIEELGQLNRCSHVDYPHAVPPLKRCTLELGHKGIHLYPEIGWMDGGKAYHDMSVEEMLEFHRKNR